MSDSNIGASESESIGTSRVLRVRTHEVVSYATSNILLLEGAPAHLRRIAATDQAGPTSLFLSGIFDRCMNNDFLFGDTGTNTWFNFGNIFRYSQFGPSGRDDILEVAKRYAAGGTYTAAVDACFSNMMSGYEQTLKHELEPEVGQSIADAAKVIGASRCAVGILNQENCELGSDRDDLETPDREPGAGVSLGTVVGGGVSSAHHAELMNDVLSGTSRGDFMHDGNLVDSIEAISTARTDEINAAVDRLEQAIPEIIGVFNEAEVPYHDQDKITQSTHLEFGVIDGLLEGSVEIVSGFQGIAGSMDLETAIEALRAQPHNWTDPVEIGHFLDSMQMADVEEQLQKLDGVAHADSYREKDEIDLGFDPFPGVGMSFAEAAAQFGRERERDGSDRNDGESRGEAVGGGGLDGECGRCY